MNSLKHFILLIYKYIIIYIYILVYTDLGNNWIKTVYLLSYLDIFK